MTIERAAVDPWAWSLRFGYHQGEVVTGATRTLYCSGQAAMDADGVPQHAGDMAAQLQLSIENLEALLGHAGMTLANVVRLNVYTTDVDVLFEHYGLLAGRLAEADVSPPSTLLQVTRLALPPLMVELEATAVA